ncbi:AraC family transcriptional regulator [Vibrio profundum]|uniref:helix-turn-helix domain-containing protein n=1 Tax=Vibrio profundum TaxID=2910247 RepID=UPI003D13CD82
MTDKSIEYLGRVVFQKQGIAGFKRLPKVFMAQEACFAFVTEGEYKVRDQTHLIDLNKHSGVLAKCTNYFYESVSEFNDQGAEAIGIFLYPEVLHALFGFDITSSDYCVDYNMKQVEVDKLLEYYRDSISILLDSPELVDDLLIESKLREFVLLMTKRTQAPSELDFIAAMFKPNFAKFEDVIQSNLYADLNVDELAALCHMSVSTFKRKFKQVYGEPPMKHITRLKINKAKVLLKDNSLRISDIVYETGFESISTFNRAFKAQVCLSPSDYRNSS